MRTTLKRGIGRGAAVNGNGRAVLPPAILTQITRYRQPLPERRSFGAKVGRVFLWLVAFAMMIALAWRVYRERSGPAAATAAKRLFAFSLLYLFLTFALLLTDHLSGGGR